MRAYTHTYGISTTISNRSNNYGADPFPDRLIRLMILSCFDGEPLPVYGDGSNGRDRLHVDYDAETIWVVLRGELDWRRRHDIESGLQQTVVWYLENQDGIDEVRSGEYREWVAENCGDR